MPAPDAEPTSSSLPPYFELVDSGTRNLLQSLVSGVPSTAADDTTYTDQPSPPRGASPIEGWGLFEAYGDTDLPPSLEQQGIALIAKSLLDRFDELSADENAERSEVDEDEMLEPVISGKRAFFQFTMVAMPLHPLGDDDLAGSSEPARKRARHSSNDDSMNPTAKWFPWQDKIVSEL